MSPRTIAGAVPRRWALLAVVLAGCAGGPVRASSGDSTGKRRVHRFREAAAPRAAGGSRRDPGAAGVPGTGGVAGTPVGAGGKPRPARGGSTPGTGGTVVAGPAGRQRRRP